MPHKQLRHHRRYILRCCSEYGTYERKSCSLRIPYHGNNFYRYYQSLIHSCSKIDSTPDGCHSLAFNVASCSSCISPFCGRGRGRRNGTERNGRSTLFQVTVHGVCLLMPLVDIRVVVDHFSRQAAMPRRVSLSRPLDSIYYK